MSERKQGTLLHLSVVSAREAVVTQYFLFVQQEGEQIREQSEGSKEDFTHPDTAACTGDRLHTGSQSKRGALRRQPCVDQQSQEQLQDPWVRLSHSSPEELPEIHCRHAADRTPPINAHSKTTTMSDEESTPQLNGTAKDITSNPMSEMSPENTSESSPGAKKGPPVAPKPTWFRQSLRKIRDEQDQKKQAKPAEQRPAVGFTRTFGVRSASSSTSLSIKQKIHSFETFSSAEGGPEKGSYRKPVAPTTSLPLMEKELCSDPASDGDYRLNETDNKEDVTSVTSEICSKKAASPCDDEAPSMQPSSDLPLSDTISTDLHQETRDCHSALDNYDRNVSPSEQESHPEEDFNRSSESRDLQSVTVGSSQADGECPPEGIEGEGEQSQSQPLSMSGQSAAPPADSHPLRGLEGESLGKILAFSNQVSQALMRSLPCHGNPASKLQDPSAGDLAGPEESEPSSDNTDKGFSVSLATLRECTIERGEGGSHDEAADSSTCAHSVIAAIPPQEIQRMIQEVKALDEETLKQLGDIHVVILHKDEGAGLGFSIAGGSDLESKALTVHKVFPSGLAAQEGTIQKGDEVLSVNGQTLRGVTHADATAALRQARSLKLAVVVVCKAAEEEGREGGGCRGEEPHPAVEELGAPFSVELEKGAGGVGFSLEGGKGSIRGDKPLVINRIFNEQSCLQRGDELLQVQGVSLQDMTRFEAWNLIKALPEGPITAVIRRGQGGVE